MMNYITPKETQRITGSKQLTLFKLQSSITISMSFSLA